MVSNDPAICWIKFKLPSCITIALPRMDCGPTSKARLSWILRNVLPEIPDSILPRSPTCLS